MTKVSEAKEAMAAAMDLRRALLRMRSVLGGNPSAVVCERHAEDLLNCESTAARLSPAELRALNKRASESTHLLQKIVAVIGDRTMHMSEVRSALVAGGVEDYPGLKNYISSRISKHSAGKGDRLFVKVRHGWYRLRSKSEQVSEPIRLRKGELIQMVYDVMGSDSVDQHEISRRLVVGKILPPDRCEPTRIMSVLINHSVRGTHCFARDKKDHKKFVAVQGNRPTMETSQLITLHAICTMLNKGPLSIPEIHERLAARKGERGIRRTIGSVSALMRENAGGGGRRMFERVSPRVYKLARHRAVLDQILSVLGSRALSPAAITGLIADTGFVVKPYMVHSAISRNSGSGMALVRVSPGLYSKNPDYRSKP